MGETTQQTSQPGHPFQQQTAKQITTTSDAGGDGGVDSQNALMLKTKHRLQTICPALPTAPFHWNVNGSKHYNVALSSEAPTVVHSTWYLVADT